MSKTNKLDTVNWFLNFLNLDLEKLDSKEKMNWIEQALTMVHRGSQGVISLLAPSDSYSILGKGYYQSIQKNINKWKYGNQINQCQSYLKNFLSDMMITIDDLKSLPEGFFPANRWHHLFPFAQFVTKINARMEILYAKYLASKEGTNNLFFRIKPGEHQEYPLAFNIEAETDEDTLLLYFWQSLDGIPIGALRQCAECNNWFLNLSKRKKSFCTPKCAARKSGKDKLHRIKIEDPDVYKEELAEDKKRATKSYKRKVEKQKA